MQNIINLYKPVGYTPLELIEALKKIHPEYRAVPLGYAGRLDPMANGVLLILAGDENKKRKTYELLPKKYTFEVLFGVETDTYDIMGLVTSSLSDKKILSPALLSDITISYLGTWEQPYPPYSSPRVKGKPLFYWARNNALSTIEIPKKKVTVNHLELIKVDAVSSETLHAEIQTRIAQVTGDFRQKEILEKWHQLLENSTYSFTRAVYAIECSSGVYVRSIAHSMGQQVGSGAIALAISRTAVGPYTIDTALRITDTAGKKE